MSSSHQDSQGENSVEEVDPSEEQSIAEEESIAPPKFNDRQMKKALEDQAKEKDEEIKLLEQEVRNLRTVNTIHKRQKEELEKEKNQYQADFTIILQRVGSVGPEAFFTRSDVDYLTNQRRSADRLQILALENMIVEEEKRTNNMKEEAKSWEKKWCKTHLEVQAVHTELEQNQKEIVEMKTENARLKMMTSTNQKVLEKHVRDLIRELEEAKGASSSSPLAKRPRLDG